MKNEPKKNTQPDRTAESHEVRAELQHNDDAIRALNEIAKEPQGEVDIPPVPDDLRDQWRERYGEAADRSEIPPENSKSGLWNFLRFATVGSIAVVAMLLIFQGEKPELSDQFQQGFVLRGGNDFTATPDTVTIFIPSERVSFADMIPTRKAGLILEAQSEADVPDLLREHRLTSAIVVYGETGALRTFPSQTGEVIQLIEDVTTADQYDFGEAIDAFLEK